MICHYKTVITQTLTPTLWLCMKKQKRLNCCPTWKVCVIFLCVFYWLAGGYLLNISRTQNTLSIYYGLIHIFTFTIVSRDSQHIAVKWAWLLTDIPRPELTITQGSSSTLTEGVQTSVICKVSTNRLDPPGESVTFVINNGTTAVNCTMDTSVSK